MAWSFVVVNVFPHGAMEIKSEATKKMFKVNGHCLKHFYEGAQKDKVQEIHLQEAIYPD